MENRIEVHRKSENRITPYDSASRYTSEGNNRQIFVLPPSFFFISALSTITKIWMQPKFFSTNKWVIKI